MSIEQQYKQLAEDIRDWGRSMGFQQVGISSIDLGDHRPTWNGGWPQATTGIWTICRNTAVVAVTRMN